MPGTSTLSLSQSGSHICLCPSATARVPRPRNAFILYRQHHHSNVVAENPGKTNPEISKIIGEQWRSLPQNEKDFWIQQGDVEKKSHLERFPDYRYQPRRSSKKGGSSNSSDNSTGICPVCKGITSGSSNGPSFVNTTPYKSQQQQQQQQPKTQNSHQSSIVSQIQHQNPQQQPQSQSQLIPLSQPLPSPTQSLHGSVPSSSTSSPSLSHAHPQLPNYYQHPPPPPPPSSSSHPPQILNSPSFPTGPYHPPAPLQPLGYDIQYQHQYPLHKSSAPTSSQFHSYDSSHLNFNSASRHQSAPEISKSFQYKPPAPSKLDSVSSMSSISSISSMGSLGSSNSHSSMSSISSGSSSISSMSSLPQLPRIVPREELVGSNGQPLTPKMSPDLRNASWSSPRSVQGSTDSPLRPFTFYRDGNTDQKPQFHASPRSNLNPSSKPKDDTVTPATATTNKLHSQDLKINTTTSTFHTPSQHSTFTHPSNAHPYHHPFSQTKFKGSLLYTSLSSLTEEENQYKKRRTSSYHDPLGNTPVNTHPPSLLSRGERYQSAIALASSNSSKLLSISEQSTPEPSLSVRDKAEILSVTCDLAVKENSNIRGKIIAIEGLNPEMIQKVSEMLCQKIGSSSSSIVLKEVLNEKKAPPSLTNEKALNIWQLACLHQTISDVQMKSQKYVILGGYLMHMADLLAGGRTTPMDSGSNDTSNNPGTSENSKQEFKNYCERWYSGAAMLRGLPGPDYLVYLQPAEGLAESEVTVAELKGGSKMLIIGGHKKMEEDIADDIIKAVNLNLDHEA